MGVEHVFGEFSWVWTLDRTALCRACHFFGCLSQLRRFLRLPKKMLLTNWVSPQNDIVIYCVWLCMCVCVFVLQSPVLYHFITVTTCRLTSSIDLYSIFQSCSAGGWRSRHLRIGGIQTVVCQFDWTPLLGKSTQITWKSTTEGSSEVTCTDTWA